MDLQTKTGVGLAMIAALPSDPAQIAVDVPDGDPPAELHLTLAYLGSGPVADEHVAQLEEIAAEAAASIDGPLVGTVTDIAKLGDDGAIVAHLESPVLTELHQRIQTAVEAVNPDWAWAYDEFLPHVTIGWANDGSSGEDLIAAGQPLIGTEITFDRVALVNGHADNTTDTEEDPENDGPADTGALPVAATTGDQAAFTLSAAGLTAGGPVVQFTDRDLDDLALLNDPNADVTAADIAGIDGGPGGAWRGVLCVEDTPTGDRRMMAFESLTWRDLPLPLMLMTRNPDGGEGHDGAVLCGRIDKVWRNGNRIMGSGVFDLESEHGAEAHRLVKAGMMRGVSADIDDVEVEVAQVLGINREILTRGRVMGATLCPFPALQEAFVELDIDRDALVATAGPAQIGAQARAFLPLAVTTDLVTVVASGAAPEQPPAAWFAAPNLDAAQPVRVTPEGEVIGYAAQFGTCHIGFADRCVRPENLRCKAGYRQFMTGQTLTADGTLVATGPIVVDTVHPNLRMSASDAQAFYAHSGSAVADVAVGHDHIGIWVHGALRPDATPGQVRALRGGDVSPDWRAGAMVALLGVNNSGFKVDTLDALVASGATTDGVAPGVPRALFDEQGEVIAMVAVGAAVKADPDELASQVAALSSTVASLVARRDAEARAQLADLAAPVHAATAARAAQAAAQLAQLAAPVTDRRQKAIGFLASMVPTWEIRRDDGEVMETGFDSAEAAAARLTDLYDTSEYVLARA